MTASARPRRAHAARRRWAVTIGATVASTWVLDAVATAAGIALARWTSLADVTPAVLLGVLVASYVGWVLALVANLRANGRLLDDAGVSTNAVSKLAHDLVAGRSRRARRAAAAWGYVLTEAVKELPYVAGALGAAAASSSVAGADAVVFLVGANLGAAGYEAAVARATSAYLLRRSVAPAPTDVARVVAPVTPDRARRAF
ncbi:MAG: hypothetical protein QM733_01425 [Ilumatobacteraceae bacterium]